VPIRTTRWSSRFATGAATEPGSVARRAARLSSRCRSSRTKRSSWSWRATTTTSRIRSPFDDGHRGMTKARSRAPSTSVVASSLELNLVELRRWQQSRVRAGVTATQTEKVAGVVAPAFEVPGGRQRAAVEEAAGDAFDGEADVDQLRRVVGKRSIARAELAHEV